MKFARLFVSGLLFIQSGCSRAPVSGVSSDEPLAAVDVRAIRRSSNAAIAAHDIEAFSATLLPEVIVTGGNGGALVGRDSVRASLARSFADPTFVSFVRITDRVDISGFKPLAAEDGHWIGRWRTTNGDEEVSGTYLAMWRRTDAGWRVRSELFVSLACRGPRMCAP
jgi:ketosteroid isomerase-like protein